MSPFYDKDETSKSADGSDEINLQQSDITNDVYTHPELDGLEEKAFNSHDIDSNFVSRNNLRVNKENQLLHRCFDEINESKFTNNQENTSIPCSNINTRNEVCHQNRLSTDFPDKVPKHEKESPLGESLLVTSQDRVEAGSSEATNLTKDKEPFPADCHHGVANNVTEICSPPTQPVVITPADHTNGCAVLYQGEDENQSTDDIELNKLSEDKEIQGGKYPPPTKSVDVTPADHTDGSSVIRHGEDENQSTDEEKLNKLSKGKEISPSSFLNLAETKHQAHNPEPTFQLDSQPKKDPAVILQGDDENQSTDVKECDEFFKDDKISLPIFPLEIKNVPEAEPNSQLDTMPKQDPHQVALPTTHSPVTLPNLNKPETGRKNTFNQLQPRPAATKTNYDQLLKPRSYGSRIQNDDTSTGVVCSDIDWFRAGPIYYGVVMGVMDTSIHSARRQLQKDFKQNFMHPYYRSRHYNSALPTKIEVYAFVAGKKGVKCKKILTLTVTTHDIPRPLELGGPLETRVTEGALIHEETFTEYPQFVEVTQPPTRRNPGDVEADGVTSDVANDPPGQQSVYINPGDIRIETYRLSTFENFPRSTPVSVPELARHGFYFTGYCDRVKCYCCGRTVEKWEIGDKPSDKRWHKHDCMLARGLGHDNVPIGGLFSATLANGNMYNNYAPQPMDVGPSQTQRFNGPVTRRSNDVTDLTGSGGTFQIQPGSTYVIGSPAARQTSPVTSTPNNPPSAGSNPPRGWRMANVISADHKRHLTNLFLNREIDRLASFSRWPTGRPNVAPVALARAGFFYLGDMDRTQCFSCGGVLRNWNYEDDAMDEHRTHFPNCRLVVGVERRNVPVSSRPETPQELAERYPLRFPMNPHMRSEASRLQTFDRRWPMNKTRVQPQDIAEAGFFFLGERDRVKCWYCNGGLQNWEYDDIPWVEHSKWFPNCQFLLAKQGQLFVYRHLSLSPHLPRPIIGRQDGAAVDPSTATPHSSQSARTQDVPPSISRARAPSPPPAIIDPQEDLHKRRERVDKEMQSETVKVVTTMGYEETIVRRTLMDQLESGNPHDADNIFDGVASLLDAVLKKEEEIGQEENEARVTSIKFPSVSSNYSALTVGSMDTNGPSSGPASGVFNVSGFDSDDEERDLYSSIKEGSSVGGMSVCAGGGATNGPTSVGRDSRARPHIWDDVPDDPESMKEFIEQKKEERLCKICFTETADMVFIPCSHMCCCKTCTEAIRNCPVCRKKIEKAIKTYVK